MYSRNLTPSPVINENSMIMLDVRASYFRDINQEEFRQKNRWLKSNKIERLCHKIGEKRWRRDNSGVYEMTQIQGLKRGHVVEFYKKETGFSLYPDPNTSHLSVGQLFATLV